jgi:hypothetical protein
VLLARQTGVPEMERNLAQLVDRLSHSHEVLGQLLLVATIFGAFSISGVVALLVSTERSRLRSFLFLMLSVSSLAFIFATSLDAVFLPAAKRPASLRDPDVVAGLLGLADVVIWSIIVGTAALMAAMGAFGFAYSRRLGYLVLVLTILTTAAFCASIAYLVVLLG